MAAMTIYGKNLKKSSCQKPLIRFSKNFTGMTFEGSPEKVVQRNLIRQKTWPQELVELCMFIRFCLFCENFQKSSTFFVRSFPNLHSFFISMRTRTLQKMSIIGPWSTELPPLELRKWCLCNKVQIFHPILSKLVRI